MMRKMRAGADVDDAQFQAFLDGDVGAREILPRSLHRRLLAVADRVGADLSPDQREEAVDEMWALILEGRGDEFDPTRAGAWTYLTHVLKDGVRRVRASYALPGTRTRASPGIEPKSRGSKEESTDGALSRHGTLPIDKLTPKIEPRTNGLAGECRAELRLLWDRTEERVRKVLVGVHIRGDSVADMAIELGMSRYQVYRVLNSAVAT